MFELLLDIVFPRRCVGCGRWGKYICDSCKENNIEYFSDQVCPYCEKASPYGLTHPRCAVNNGLDGMFVLAHYRGLIPKTIHAIKYQGEYAICSELAQLTIQKYHRQFQFGYFVPVPLSHRREAERGFNQAEKLASVIAGIMNDELRIKNEKRKKIQVVNILHRTRNTLPQFDLKFDERKNNVRGAFTINQNLIIKDLSGFSFGLVDDVVTTGSTIFECAKELKKAGAKKVWAITIARGG